MYALSRIGGLMAFFKFSSCLQYLHRRNFEKNLAKKYKLPDDEDQKPLKTEDIGRTDDLIHTEVVP